MNAATPTSTIETDMQVLGTLPREEQYAMVIAWLLENDADRSGVAAGLMKQIGPDATGWLLDEALSPGTGTARRLKLLEVIAAHRLPLDADQWQILFAAQRRFGSAVGKWIAQIILQRQVVSSGAG